MLGNETTDGLLSGLSERPALQIESERAAIGLDARPADISHTCFLTVEEAQQGPSHATVTTLAVSADDHAYGFSRICRMRHLGDMRYEKAKSQMRTYTCSWLDVHVSAGGSRQASGEGSPPRQYLVS